MNALSSADAQWFVFLGGEIPLNNMSVGAGLREGRRHSTLRLHAPLLAAFCDERFQPLRRREE